MNKISNFYDNLFGENQRLGGQILVENIFYLKYWKNVAKDQIFKYFYYDKDFQFKKKTLMLYIFL